MNKGELVHAITERAAQKGITIHKKTAEEVLTVMLDVIIDSVAEGHKVTLVGFGSFEPRVRKAREGRNPKTGEKMDIPETTVPAFSAGKSFKERVNPGGDDLDDEE